MNKKVFLASLLLGLSCLSVTACGSKHKFDEKWANDETNHWHSCLTEGHSDQKDIGEHTFSDWEVKTPAGVHIDKVEYRTCTVCGYKVERTIADSGYHSFSSDWKYDETGHWHVCTYEGCEAKDNVIAHVLTEVAEVPATCSATGIAKHKKCNDCGAILDLDNHLVTDESTLVLAKEASKHNFGSWIEEVKPNCGTQTSGVKGHKDCLDCGKHFDSAGNELSDLAIAWSHSYESYSSHDYHCQKCSVCGDEKEKVIHDLTNHSNLTYECDGNEHWLVCKTCEYKFEATEHTFGAPVVDKAASYDEAGSQTETCTACGYVKISSIDKLAAKDRTIAISKDLSKTYNGKTVDKVLESAITVTTTSLEDEITSIKTNGSLGEFYTIAFFDNEKFDGQPIASPTDAGTYWVRVSLAGTNEWQRAGTTQKFTISPNKVYYFSPYTRIEVSTNEISNEGVCTIDNVRSLEDDGCTLKVKANLKNYNGFGDYTYTYSDLFLTAADGSTDASYLKNYTIVNQATSSSAYSTIQAFETLTDTFTIKEVLKNEKTVNEEGKQVSTITAKVSIEEGKSISFKTNSKILFNKSIYATITKLYNTSTSQNWYSRLYHSSYTNAAIVFSFIGSYSDSSYLTFSFTMHSHSYADETGLCDCGDSITHAFEYEENGVGTSLSVVDNKAHFSFEYCEDAAEQTFELVVKGNYVSNIKCFRGKNSVCDSLEKTQVTGGYKFSLPSSVVLQGNEQYDFCITVDPEASIKNLTVSLKAPFHQYGDDNECDNGCGWVRS